MITSTTNMDIVNSILSIPEIWNEISPEGVEPFDVPYEPGVVYFLINDIDGVVIYHQYRDGLKIHPNVVPGRRGKEAFQAIEETIQAMFALGHRVIYAEIDPTLKHLVWTAKHMGFRLIEQGERDLFVRRLCHS